MLLACLLLLYVPEDSNTQYLLDKQLAHYFPSWIVHWDSSTNALRTSQGCLDLKNWYIDFDARVETKLSSWLGLRYRNKYLGDYNKHVSNHYFEPFIQVRENLRILLSVAPHYYKGEDQLGAGFFLGKDYLNYLETLVIVEDFDRNFSLHNIPEGRDKVIYECFPFNWKTNINKYWQGGYFNFNFELSNRYWLRSTEKEFTYPPYFYERGLHRAFCTRFWQDISKLRFGGLFDLQQSEFYHIDTSEVHEENNFEIIVEPMIAYRVSDKWIPTLYFTYNYKTLDDSSYLFGTGMDSIVDYQRDIYAYLVDVEFHPGGNFVWHFGLQQQFYNNNQGVDKRERRLTLGLEYRYKDVWIYIVEAMEGDLPMPGWLHNRTYVQLMMRF